MRALSLSRRSFLGGLTLLAPPLLACTSSSRTAPSASPTAPASSPKPRLGQQQFAAIERSIGGRLGVAVLDTANRIELAYREHELFPMCSTFKLLLAGAVLLRVDRGEENLERKVSFTESDLLEHAPFAREHLGAPLSVRALCAASVEVSDNTAANLLLNTLGGPAGLTHYVRSWGDQVTRLDRDEPTLNTALPDDPRDTTTPAAMLGSMKALLLESALSPSSRTLLTEWLVNATTGITKLRAGLPATWKAGDKTGMGNHGATNDIGILWPPENLPILVCVYSVGSEAPVDERNRALAEVAAVVVSMHERGARR